MLKCIYLAVITRLFVAQPFFKLTFKTIESGTIPYLSWGAIPQWAAFNGEDILTKSGPSVVDFTVSSGFWPSAASSVFFVDEFS